MYTLGLKSVTALRILRCMTSSGSVSRMQDLTSGSDLDIFLAGLRRLSSLSLPSSTDTQNTLRLSFESTIVILDIL